MRLNAAYIGIAAALLTSCGPKEFVHSEEFPEIFPDYIGVTVPENIAPLNFRMADGRLFKARKTRIADTIFVEVSAWRKGSRSGISYKAFPIYVSSDAIDPYIAYRLIEPGYESWREMGLYSRELASFKERPIVTNEANGRGCVNCHTFSGGDPANMLFHARGKGGGTVFVNPGGLKKVDFTNMGLNKQAVYPAWHPDGRYIAFSSNSTQQSFSLEGSQPVEVFDHWSDIILYDMETGEVTTSPAVSGEERMETFPAWSPDGRKLYFCAADSISDVSRNRAEIHYSINSIDFDPSDGSFSGEASEVWGCDSLSASFPRLNGDWMLMTVAGYATFPIWHREADLWLMNIRTGECRPANELNSDDTESYHSWSSNGKWLIFSSRRLDGRYTRLFISHFDTEGHFTKPFLLPQKNPDHNDLRLKSYNVPDFVKGNPGNLTKRVSKLF